jgi:transcriptional regulator with XRE-family HTH domain
MDSTFGARLRTQREEQQIPLATIAEQTKIKLSLLEGLERDDVARWPTGIFRRSYFRAYARAIGLDPDRSLREFLAIYPDPDADRDLTQVLAQARELNFYASRRPPTRLRCLIDSAVSALPALHPLPSPRVGTVVPPPPPASSDEGHQALAESHQPAEPVVADVTPPETVSPAREEPGVDFNAVAGLCAQLARANDVRDVTPVLEQSANVLHAIGLILWMADPLGYELLPVFSSGYAPEMIAQVGRVPRDSDNAIAFAFRTAEARVVDRRDMATGAVAVPLVTPTGCVGVLGIELRDGGERLECVRAAATILAAQLSMLVGVPALADALGAYSTARLC